MKHLTVALVLVVLAAGADAALVDNATFTTDSVSGLDWLDLTATNHMLMVDAVTSNPGWRLPTNAEVENLFWQLFDGFYATNSNGESWSNIDGVAYADQDADVLNFHSLFGQLVVTITGTAVGTSGLYFDESGIVRTVAATYYFGSGNPYSQVIGLDHPISYDAFYDTVTPNDLYGTYLVRSSIVPVPAAAWLFGSALGLLGWMRRKAA